LLNAPIPGPGLNGEPAPWTLAAFAYLGVVDAFTELDPDFVPPAGPLASGGRAVPRHRLPATPTAAAWRAPVPARGR